MDLKTFEHFALLTLEATESPERLKIAFFIILQIPQWPSWNRFLEKVRQKNQNFLNSKLFIGSILESGFEATLRSKPNVVSLWKCHFSVFCQFLSDKVESLFWESETKRSKLFKSKVGSRKHFRKWFWSYLELIDECSELSKKAFFQFFANFWVTKLRLFSGKAKQSLQDHLNSKLVIGRFNPLVPDVH